MLDAKNPEEYGVIREAVEQLAQWKQGKVFVSHPLTAQ